MSGGMEDAAERERGCYAPLRIIEDCHGIELPEGFMKNKSALNTQVGGNHYKDLKIQPMEYSMANGLNACQHTAIKYITRYKSKGGIEDLKKAIHAIELLIEFEEKDVK